MTTFGMAGRYSDEERVAIDAKLLVGVEAIERGDVSELTSADWDRLRDRIRGSDDTGGTAHDSRVDPGVRNREPC